jgi:transposase
MVSAVDLAKRAFVKLLLQSAVAYAITLSLTRDSSTAAAMAAFRKVTARLHPDKGGNLEQQQALNAARDKWESAAAEAPGRGKKRKATDAEEPASSLQLAQVLPIRVEKYLSKHFRIQSVAVLLTYQKFKDFGKWSKFTKFIKVHLKEWGVKLWCATMVLTVAPTGPTDRKNYCLHGETHMWRKRCEANKPELAGEDPFADQIPLARAIPLWAGISQQGYCEIIFHKTKKVNTEEWVKEGLKKGKLMAAVRKLQPTRPSGARRILCDNESFLSAKKCALFYKSKGIVLLQIPPRSPDLNPIEMYWAWVRRQMRLKDLEDLRCRRPALGKTATKARVRALLRTKKAQQVAGRMFMTLKAK